MKQKYKEYKDVSSYAMVWKSTNSFVKEEAFI